MHVNSDSQLQSEQLGHLLAKSNHWIDLKPLETYTEVTVRLWVKGVIARGRRVGSEIGTSRRLRVSPNQFILSKIDARNGAFGLIPEELEGAVVSSDFPVFDALKDRLLPEYLGWVSKTRRFVDECNAASEGTTNRKRLREDRFYKIAIPLPPLAEQQRIVAKIEHLAAKIDKAHGLRQRSLIDTEAYLAASSMEQFRQLRRCERPLIENVAEVKGGIQRSPVRTPVHHPIRYLTVAHVRRNQILCDDPRYFEVPPDELPRRALKTGDVLIIEGNGSADQIGRTAVYWGELDPCVHQNHVIRMRPDSSRVNSEYLNTYLNSPAGRDEVQSRSRTTSGLRCLSVGRIKQIKVPLPCLAEQNRIVKYLDNLQAKVDRLKTLQQKTAVELDALLPSILDKAFKGEL